MADGLKPVFAIRGRDREQFKTAVQRSIEDSYAGMVLTLQKESGGMDTVSCQAYGLSVARQIELLEVMAAQLKKTTFPSDN